MELPELLNVETKPSILLYSHTITPRLQYVAGFLSDYYRLPVKLVCDENKYIAATDPYKINYSHHRLLPGEVWIHSHVLLFESSVRLIKIECFQHHQYKAFFEAEGDTGFDLFAALFYLITRYEEYLPHQKDLYGRYAHQQSLAFKEGFLHLPLVNIWLEDFRGLLLQKFPGLQLPVAAFSLQTTYDIDMAWSHRGKGTKRAAGGVAKAFFTGKWGAALQRLKVIRGALPDPFDAYEWMDSLHRKYALKPLWFFLVAGKKGRFDKNTERNKPAFKKLVKDIAAGNAVGLHPSWASGDDAALLTEEKTWLQATTNKAITASRQHYLRFHLPATYRRLINAGITDDYSMGYGTINGFRASVTTPFFWYDVKEDCKTNLCVHPFCFMDANAFYEEGKTPQQALKDMLDYYEVVRSVNGTMITIWHNSFLGIDEQFAGWREVYEMFLREV